MAKDAPRAERLPPVAERPAPSERATFLLSRLILLFVAVPLLELALLLWVGQWIGLGPTIALVVATGFAGAALTRQQGLRAFLSVQRKLAMGQVPSQSLLDGLSILVGGALLLTPGILTDVLGFSLILPLSRRALQGLLQRRLKRRIKEGALRVTSFGSGGPRGAEWFAGVRARTRWPRSHADESSDDRSPDGEPRQELGTHPRGRNPLRRHRPRS